MCKWNAFLIDSLFCVCEYGEHRKREMFFPTASGWISLDIPMSGTIENLPLTGMTGLSKGAVVASFGGTGNGRNSFGTQWPDSVSNAQARNALKLQVSEEFAINLFTELLWSMEVRFFREMKTQSKG